MTSTTETKQHLFEVLKGFDTAMLVTHPPVTGCMRGRWQLPSFGRSRHVFLDQPAVA